MLHLVERAGLGMLMGCGAALPLIGILLWRGMPVLSMALVFLAIGMAAGVLWGIGTRPSRVAAAMEADRQLGWADLLSSAILTHRQSPDDPWAGAVRAAADARCRGVSPSTVVLHRLGARTWGGIGLATALVLALGLIPTLVEPSRADRQPDVSSNPLASLTEQSQPLSVGRGSVPRGTATQQEPEDPNASRMSGIEPIASQMLERDSSRNADSPQHKSGTDSAGRGTGASESKLADQQHPLANTSGTQANQAAANGAESAGAGRSFNGITGSGNASGAAAGYGGTRRTSPPWQTADWPADSNRANAAVESGRIPDQYRDVIRGYFDRQ